MFSNQKISSSARILAVAILCGFVMLASGCLQSARAQSNTDRRLVAEATRITQDSFPVYTKTPRGAHVFASARPRAEILRAIDDGLTQLFAIAHRHRYTKRLEYSDYTIFIARPDRLKDSHGAYSPDVAVAAGQYAGSAYDQGGFIYAAGMVMAFNPCAFIIAEHGKDFARVSNVVRYEGEHLILYHNDRRLFEKTADHSAGGQHPILQ